MKNEDGEGQHKKDDHHGQCRDCHLSCCPHITWMTPHDVELPLPPVKESNSPSFTTGMLAIASPDGMCVYVLGTRQMKPKGQTNFDSHGNGKNGNKNETMCKSDPHQSRSPQFIFSWVPWRRSTGARRMEADNSKHNGAATKKGG